MLEMKLLHLSSKQKKSSIPKIMAAGSSDTLVPIYQTTRYHIPFDNNLYLLYFLLASSIPTTEAEGKNTLVVRRVLPCVMYAHSSTNSSVCVSMTREKLRPHEKKSLNLLLNMTLNKKTLNLYMNMTLCALSVFFHKTVNSI
jgi:hypothetical protein